MTDEQILHYLQQHNGQVNALEFIDIMNESPQIEGENYNSTTDTLTIYTHDHIFDIKWNLRIKGDKQ